jgi:hypothetical protein
MTPQAPTTSHTAPDPGVAIWRPAEFDRSNGTAILDAGGSASDSASSGEIVYHGWPQPDGQVTVVVQTRPGTHRPLVHLVRHSPSGLNWVVSA